MEVSGKRGKPPLDYGTQSFYEFFCQPCDVDGIHLKAEGYCETCKEYLCKVCFKHHTRPTAMKNHVLKDEQHMPMTNIPSTSKPATAAKPTIVCSEMCAAHVGETIKYFCGAHDQLGCSECLRQNHGLCQGVLYIPEAAESAEYTREFEDLVRHINALSNSVEQMKKVEEKNMERAKKCEYDAVAAIDNFQEAATLLFERHAKAMKVKVKVSKHQRDALLRNKQASFKDMLHDFEKLSSDLATKHGSDRKGDLFVAVKNGKKQVQAMTRDMAGWDQADQYLDFLFLPNGELVNPQMELGSLLDVTEKKEQELRGNAICYKFLERHGKRMLDDLEKKYKKQDMKLTLAGDYVLLSGKHQCIQEVHAKLKKLYNSIVSQIYYKKMVAVRDVFGDERGKGTIETIEKNTRCLIHLPEELEALMKDESHHASQEGRGLHWFRQFRREEIQQMDTVTLMMHSDSMANLDKCKQELDKAFESVYITHKIDGYREMVKSLNQKQVDEMLNVSLMVIIKVDKTAGIFTISGPMKHVMDAQIAVEHRLSVRKRDVEARFRTIADQIQWYHENITPTGVDLEPYELLPNYQIETAYKNGDPHVELKDSDNVTYIIDFNRFKEYLKTNVTDSVKVVRKDILKATSAALPRIWEPMKDQENLKIVPLAATDKEFNDVATQLIQEVKTGKYSQRITFDKNKLAVVKIERIQNKALYQQYAAKKKLLTEERKNLPRNMPIERTAWHGHGTTQDVVSSIQTHGFNRSYCVENGIWYGAGVYFAGDASYSARTWLSTGAQNQTTGIKGYIFLCKILTGHLIKGNKDMRYLPPIDPARPTVLYDSAVDDVKDPMEFVIFHDNQAYPEYLIYTHRQ